MKREVRAHVATRAWVAELAWFTVAVRRSTELASTTSVNELAHATSTRAISPISAELVANGGARCPRPTVMPVWTYAANRVAIVLSASDFHARAPCGPSEAGNERVEATNCSWLTTRFCT